MVQTGRRDAPGLCPGDGVNVLGVNCSTNSAYLAVAVDGALADGHVEHIDAPTLAESSEELASVLDEVSRVIGEVEADKVVLLKPEGGPRPKRTHTAFVPRIALETLVRLAAVQTQTEIEVLPRPTVRTRLNLPAKGKLLDHVSSRIPRKVGKNWCEERQLAALAAVAGERDG
jgi:hypothetical protein